MASELKIKWIETGITAYAIVCNATGQVWNGSAYEDFTDANIANYDVALTEAGTDSQWYIGTMPSSAAALAVSVSYHKQAGGGPAVTDTLIGTEDYRLTMFGVNGYSQALNRVKTDMIYNTGSVNDASATTTTFVTTFLLKPTDSFNDLQLSFIDGNLEGQTKPILSYTADVGGAIIVVAEPFTEAPGDGDMFDIIRIHTHPVSQIQSGLATADELAKVPKSDSNVTWNATALGSIQSEATDALNAYDPPTKAEMDSALAAADDAVLAAIAALNNLSSAGAQAAAEAALAAYDAATSADVPTANQNADAYLDRSNGVETNLTPRQLQRLIFAALAGLSSGHASAGATGAVFQNLAATKDRITVDYDSDGNRTSITLDLT